MKPFVRPMMKVLLLLLSLTPGLLWILMQLSEHQYTWIPSSYILSNSWLSYTDDGGGPESACDCLAILQDDGEEIEKAKLLSLSRSFHKRVQTPDEFYINATQDCRFDCGFCCILIVLIDTFTQDTVKGPLSKLYLKQRPDSR